MEEQIFDTFFNNTIEGIIIIEDGFIKSINSAMLDILEYSSKDELIGNLATGILIPAISQKYLEYDNAIFEEISLVSKDGRIIPAIMKINDFNNDEKSYKMVFVLNLTELKEKEALLLEQSRMAAMGEMISMIAHQWKQPLSSVAAVVSHLKLRINMKKYDETIFNEKIVDIEKYIAYMSDTIEDFRNFFKYDKEKEFVNLNFVVDMALEILEKPFSNKGIEIINSKEELPALSIYKNELLQVVLNILNNSKDAFLETAIKEEAKIFIEYEDCQSYQKITFCDNAGGIPEKIMGNIFEPYFSTKDKKNGTGLGLYMCRVIIEKNCNGKIYASNKDNGACFEIIIEK